VVAGLPGYQAYAAAYPNSNLENAATNAAHLRRKRHVNAEIVRLREEMDACEGSAVLTLLERRKFLARVVRASIATTPQNSDLWQRVKRSKNEVRCYVLEDKLDAIRLDNKLAGDPKAEADEEDRQILLHIMNGPTVPFPGKLPLALPGPQRKFCEGIVAGMLHCEAYMAAYPESSRRTAERNSNQLLKDDDVQAEIARLREKANALGGAAVLSHQEKRLFLARLVRACVDTTHEESDLWQSMRDRRDGAEYRLPNKLEAVRIDTEMEAAGNGAAAGSSLREWLEEVEREERERIGPWPPETSDPRLYYAGPSGAAFASQNRADCG
jgi:hypothetical protein